ncbi:MULTISPECIES: tRNA-dependent cyclodipeptide synthase [unclassified Streptomyces]|uniref:tRNA-dependent cyclodipeptide synthase n=1 Tax=unclassified Streptomyces TaxID=2593676 RepID=UPI0034071232
MDDALVDVQPCSPACARILDRRGHIVLLVSPGNPYFSAHRLTTMLRWAHQEMSGVDVVVSDLDMTAATYLGQGRSQQEAHKKARADVRQMASRIRRARIAADADDVRVSEFKDWIDHPEYRQARAYLDQAIEHPDYRPLLREGTRTALKAKMPDDWEPTEDQINTGLLHSERALPFILNAAKILGVPEAACAYSRPAPQVTYFFTGHSTFKAFPGQGYLGLRVRE